MSLFILRIFFVSSIVYMNLMFFGVNPIMAQENAYPLQMSEGKTSHRPEVPGVNGLVTAGHPLASMAGLRILMAGGNAIDASVAVLATLNVVRPQMSGAGGNGFLTYFDKNSGDVHSLTAAGAAPKALVASELEAEELNKGILAGVVPGLLGGWVSMLKAHGSMSLSEVLMPALEYAENGHPIEASVVQAIESQQDLFRSYPTSARTFLPGNKIPKVGELFRMPELASTFRKLMEAEQTASDEGKSRGEALDAAFDRFYSGDIADEFTRFYAKEGGLFAKEDFKEFSPIWSKPLHVKYRGYDIYSSPPTSRGGLEVLMQMKLIERFDIEALGEGNPLLTHLMVEAIQVAKSDIYQYVADPNLFSVPTEGMLSENYISLRSKLISEDNSMTYPMAGRPDGHDKGSNEFWNAGKNLQLGSDREVSHPGSTTSFSIMDKEGNIVACTPTHGGAFGTGVVVGNTGITFNNGTRIGSTSPYSGHVNYARGGQVPILNNSPVIVLKDGEFVLALGTPGGETIGQTQFQVLVNVLDLGMSVQEAIEAPRFSLFARPNFYRAGSEITMRIEDRISIEHFRGLQKLGHNVELAPSYSLGSIQAILKNISLGTFMAGADPRRAAYAVGW
jgi:gamma-glutamyltranspeptidase/glutathione hydrolase